MRTINTTIKCKTSSPLFMYGVANNNNSQPELRAPSIKGAMRYIWRAVQCATSEKINALRDKEFCLFGGVTPSKSYASRMRIFVKGFDIGRSIDINPLLPHRNSNNMKRSAIKNNATFDVVISTFKSSEEEHDNFVRLFILTTFLSGFGRRSRKGMGSVEITQISGDGNTIDYSPTPENICELLNKISILDNIVNYYFKNGIIKPIEGERNTNINYPCIEKVLFSKITYKNTDELIKSIGELSHYTQLTQNKPVFIGHINPKRFASPVICSSLPCENGYKCVITQIHCTETMDEAAINERDEYIGKLVDGEKK